jgi:hypothetical protein
MVRAYVLPQDKFEWIASRLRNSTQPNAAFGDSHVAAVPDYNSKDFVNLGVGATTIKRMDQRVRYYFSKIKPGEVIIQADPHLFADYRLEAPGSYVTEDYSDFRLRIFDPQHRGFMQKYWTTLLASGRLRERESTVNDELWHATNRLQKGNKEKTAAAPEPTSEPAAPAVSEPAAPAASEPAAPAASEPAAPAASEPATPAVSEPAAPAASEPAAPAVSEPPVSNKGPAEKEAPAPSLPPATKADQATLAKFDAFMDEEVAAHTPVANFREREQATVYRNMIEFLVAGGAKVCLVNYPVDRYYRERADRIPAFAEVRNFYKEVAQENHIPYVSFWNRFDDPSMFQNTDHVNENGSPILAREAREACFGKSRPSRR